MIAAACITGLWVAQKEARRKQINGWPCRYIDFNKPDNIRLWPDASRRPKGFYSAMTGLSGEANSVPPTHWLW
jgi:hypothetical protein